MSDSPAKVHCPLRGRYFSEALREPRIVTPERGDNHMAKRIAVPWGDRPSQAYVEVEVTGEVLPKDVKDKYVRPMYAFRSQDGYRIASFDDQLNPETLDVKAGTNGTVTL